MGRGDRRTPPGQVLRNVDPPCEVVLADDALDELDELIGYIRRDSPKNARAVYDAISKRLVDLRTGPEFLGHIDRHAEFVPPGATARITTVKKVSLYYLFPMARQDRSVVFVLSVRRGRRLPLEQPDYARRWLEEISKLHVPSEAPEQS